MLAAQEARRALWEEEGRANALSDDQIAFARGAQPVGLAALWYALHSKLRRVNSSRGSFHLSRPDHRVIRSVGLDFFASLPH